MKLLAEPNPPDDDIVDDDADHTGPQRRCLVTRESFDRETLLRFVVGPGDALVFDVAATLPGRGLWLSARRDVIDMAIKRGVFAKAARRRLITPERLADRVEAVLENRLVELLGLARRAGSAVAGFEKVKERLSIGHCALLVAASDGSEAEQARVRGHHDIKVVRPLSAQRLGAVFGRDRTVHVAIGPGRLAGMIATEAAKLAGVRPAAIATAAESGQRVPERKTTPATATTTTTTEQTELNTDRIA